MLAAACSRGDVAHTAASVSAMQAPSAAPTAQTTWSDSVGIVDTPYPMPRGVIVPIGSFGNTGFTGASPGMDPGSAIADFALNYVRAHYDLRP
jgi:hypothetical protein